MKTFRYAGRLDGGDSTPGQTLVSRLNSADIAYIDDPISFPWELIDVRSESCPLVIDISECTADALTALVPVLSNITEYDIVTKRAQPHSEAAQTFATLVGATYQGEGPVGPSPKSEKAMSQREASILRRATVEHDATAIDHADLDAVNTDPLSPGLPFDGGALAIRVPGATIRTASHGFHALVNAMRSATGLSEVAGVWGVRSEAGAPLDRAVIVLRKAR